MLAAAMRREAGSLVKESSRNRSCAAASRLALAIPRIAYEARMSTVACLWVEVSRPMGMGVRHRGQSMVKLVAFCRSLGRGSPHLVALALCSAAIVGSVSPASARSHHGVYRHAYLRHLSRHTVHHHYAYTRHYAVKRHYASSRYRHLARGSRWDAGVAQMQARGFDNGNASLASSSSSGGMANSGGYGSSSLVAEARRYIGGNPT